MSLSDYETIVNQLANIKNSVEDCYNKGYEYGLSSFTMPGGVPDIIIPAPGPLNVITVDCDENTGIAIAYISEPLQEARTVNVNIAVYDANNQYITEMLYTKTIPAYTNSYIIADYSDCLLPLADFSVTFEITDSDGYSITVPTFTLSGSSIADKVAAIYHNTQTNYKKGWLLGYEDSGATDI